MNTSCTKGLLIATLAILVSACSSSDKELNPSAEGNGGILSSHAIAFSPVGGEWHMTVTSIVPWHLEIPENGSWLQVSTPSGKEGTTDVLFKAGVNSNRKERSLKVKCVAEDHSFEETITISQPYPYLSVRHKGSSDWDPADTLRFNWNHYEGSIISSVKEKIHIKSNVDWRIIPENGSANTPFDTVRTHEGVFLGLSILEGNGDAELEILPNSPNFSASYRHTAFQIIPVTRNESGGYTDIRDLGEEGKEAVDGFIIQVEQRNLKFLIDDSAGDKEYGLSELNEVIELSIDSEIPWSIDLSYADVSWLRFSRHFANAGKVSMTITADGANPSRDLRQTEIRLKSEVGADRIIKIYQRPFILEVDTDTFEFLNNDASEKALTVKTTGQFHLENVPDWLTYSISSYHQADSTYRIDLSLDHEQGQNLTLDTIVSSGFQVISENNALTCPITVSQAPFVFDVDAPEKLALEADDTEEMHFKVSCSSEWTVTSSDEDVVLVTKEDESSFVLVPVENESDQIRTAEVTVKSVLGDYQFIIHVFQNAAV